MQVQRMGAGAVDPGPAAFSRPTVAGPARRAQYAGAVNTMASNVLARAISILGHPLLLLSLALLATAAGRGSRAQTWRLGIGLAVFAALVLAYSGWQVRRQHWRHVDASGRHERRHLNHFLLFGLISAALLAWYLGAAREILLALTLSAAIIALALATARHCTLSLHLAFAVFTAWLLAPLTWWWLAAGLAWAACIAWSRLRLSRHAPRDLVAGAIAGTLAGACFVLAVHAWRA